MDCTGLPHREVNARADGYPCQMGSAQFLYHGAKQPVLFVMSLPTLSRRKFGLTIFLQQVMRLQSALSIGYQGLELFTGYLV